METPVVFLPTLDPAILQQKTNEYAMKGAIESIKDFYTGYSSPYTKAINQSLNEKPLGTLIEVPDIIATINESLSAAVDEIANEALAKTFVPLVKRFLTREPQEISFSDILKKFVQANDKSDSSDFYVDMEISIHGWYDVKVSNGKRDYSLTLHQDYSWRGAGKKYILLSLPYDKQGSVMKLSLDGVTLELPYTRDVLKDDFTSYIARLIISKSTISIDCTDFTEEMFSEHE